MQNFSKILIFFVLFSSLSIHAQKYQYPEMMAVDSWASLTQLLQKEAAHFQGKSGRVRLLQSDFTDFKIHQLTITEKQITLDMHFTNRFFEETFQELKRTDVYNLEDFDFRIKTVSITYGDQYYFDYFPDALFLKFELLGENINKETSIREKEKSETEIWTTKPTVTTKTSSFQIPIRAKSREKIFKAIDQFQSTLLKKELQDETNH